MDGVLVDFKSGIAKLSAEDIEKHIGYYDYIPGIFATTDPIPGGVEAYMKLRETYEVYFLSRPCYMNPSSYTDKRNWIAKHIG